jgi:hypothetical protein
VNLNALDHPEQPSVTSRHFDGRNWEQAAARLQG